MPEETQSIAIVCLSPYVFILVGGDGGAVDVAVEDLLPRLGPYALGVAAVNG